MSESTNNKDVNAGLRAGDVNQLRGQAGDLQRVTQLLSSIMPDGDRIGIC